MMARGFNARTDSVGNVSVNNTGPGALSQFNRLAGGSIVQYVDVTASGVPAGMSGPCIVFGAQCISGTSPTLDGYDALSAAGNKQMTTGTGTAGAFYPICGSGATAGLGVMMNAGFYATIGGTTPVWRIYFVAAV